VIRASYSTCSNRAHSARHLLRQINPIVMRVLVDLREKLKPFYSETGRPSIDPELMLRRLDECKTGGGSVAI
jgi:transposase